MEYLMFIGIALLVGGLFMSFVIPTAGLILIAAGIAVILLRICIKPKRDNKTTDENPSPLPASSGDCSQQLTGDKESPASTNDRSNPFKYFDDIFVFVGFVFLIIAFYTIFNNATAGIIWLSLGILLIILGVLRQWKCEKRQNKFTHSNDISHLPARPAPQQNQTTQTKEISSDCPMLFSTQPTDFHYLAYQYDDVKFYPPFEIVSKVNKLLLRPGVNIILRTEPKNTYDNRAVALYVAGHKIGYLLRGTLQDMANDYLSKRLPIKATLSSLTRNGNDYQGFISLSFYRKVEDRPQKRRGYSEIDIRSFRPTDPEAHPDTPLTGKNIVFSGYFSIPIENAMQIAVDAGATLRHHVTKNVNYLVVGKQDPSFLNDEGLSSKEATAKRLMEEQNIDIHIINEETFLELARTSQPIQ